MRNVDIHQVNWQLERVIQPGLQNSGGYEGLRESEFLSKLRPAMSDFKSRLISNSIRAPALKYLCEG